MSILDQVDDETREGLTLVADLMEASMRSTHDASNRYAEAIEKDRDSWARLLIALFEKVNEAAEQVTSRRLESVLDRYAPMVAQARDTLARSPHDDTYHD